MMFRNGEDPLKEEILDALNLMGMKWVSKTASFRNMSWMDMVHDILALVSIVPQFEKHANPKIDQKIRDVLKCDSSQHNELIIDELNRVKPTYAVFTASYLECGCVISTGHIINSLILCSDHIDEYDEPADSAPVWESAYRHSHNHSKNACLFRYPLELSKEKDGSVTVDQSDYEKSFQTALDNKQLNLDVDKLDWKE